jgi:hypothetical protein
MDSTIAAPLNGAIDSYRRDLKIAEMIAASGRILMLYVMVISVIKNSPKMMNSLKDSLRDEENRNNLTFEVRQIRDGFVSLYELSQKTGFLKPFLRSLEKTTINWDDFAEDCAVNSDPQIKDLLHRVDNAL